MIPIENDSARMLEERIRLSTDRIREMITETSAAEPFGDFFRKMAQFIVFTEEICRKRHEGTYLTLPEKELAEDNRKLYEELLPDEENAPHYSVSYANPAYAAQKLGKDYGPLFSWLCMEVRGLIPLGFRGDRESYYSDGVRRGSFSPGRRNLCLQDAGERLLGRNAYFWEREIQTVCAVLYCPDGE